MVNSDGIYLLVICINKISIYVKRIKVSWNKITNVVSVHAYYININSYNSWGFK